MTDLIARIHNTQTDKIVERLLNKDELADADARKLKAEETALKQAEAATAKAALLAKLGITEEEAKLLLS